MGRKLERTKNKAPGYWGYRDMIKRCYNPTHKDFKYYGGKGITVCDRWKEDFWNFHSDMGIAPKGKTLDRIDVTKEYSKENCRWADWFTQARNKSNAQKIQSKYPGVSWRQIDKTWAVYYKGKHIGFRKDELAAAKLYRKVVREDRVQNI